MQKVIITTGIPASGKSTWAKSIVEKEPKLWSCVNRDSLRIMLNNYECSKINSNLVKNVRNSIIVDVLNSGKNLVVDECNFNSTTFKDVCGIVSELNIDASVEEKVFPIELDVAITRNATRTGYGLVPENVIRKFYADMNGDKLSSYKTKSKTYTRVLPIPRFANPTIVLPRCIIVDLDGTVALFNKDKNSIYLDAHNRNPYDASSADEDTINSSLQTVIKALHKTNNINVIFMSGRKSSYRPQTESFLKKHFEMQYELYMREDGDQRSDVIVKKELYEQYILNKYDVIACFDDRLKICRLWYNLGLPTFRFGDPDAVF